MDSNAILVDPFDKTTKKIKVTDHYFYKECKALLKITGPIDVLTLDPENMAIVDDEGLLKNADEQRYFKVKEYPQALAGRAVIIGYDEEGENTDVTYNPDTIEWMPETHTEDAQITIMRWS